MPSNSREVQGCVVFTVQLCKHHQTGSYLTCDITTAVSRAVIRVLRGFSIVQFVHKYSPEPVHLINRFTVCLHPAFQHSVVMKLLATLCVDVPNFAFKHDVDEHWTTFVKHGAVEGTVFRSIYCDIVFPNYYVSTTYKGLVFIAISDLRIDVIGCASHFEHIFMGRLKWCCIT